MRNNDCSGAQCKRTCAGKHIFHNDRIRTYRSHFTRLYAGGAMGESSSSSERSRSTEASSSERLYLHGWHSASSPQDPPQASGHYRRFSSDTLLASALPAVSTAHCTVAHGLDLASWRTCRGHMVWTRTPCTAHSLTYLLPPVLRGIVCGLHVRRARAGTAWKTLQLAPRRDAEVYPRVRPFCSTAVRTNNTCLPPLGYVRFKCAPAMNEIEQTWKQQIYIYIYKYIRIPTYAYERIYVRTRIRTYVL